MQSVEIQGLDKVKKALEAAPDAIREARAQVLDELGEELLGAVQQRIGGSGRVASVQEYRVGSGKGGHAVRPSSGSAKRKRKSRAKMRRVPGKYMYQDTGAQELSRAAETAAQRIEDAAMKALEGGTE